MMTSRLAGIDTGLYLVTDTGQCAAAGRTVPATVYQAVLGGAGIVQVRDKRLDDHHFYTLTVDVLDAVSAARHDGGIEAPVPVFVNDRIDVAARLLDSGADVHMHVGQTDAPAAEVRARLGEGPLLGVSAATAEEFTAGRAAGADLFGVGPVYDTATKADAPNGMGADGLAALVPAAGLSCVAIGGITAERATGLAATGVVGVCVVSAICAAADPRAAAAELRASFAAGTR